MIMENYWSKQKNLSTTWIDYKNAFDSAPHEWILKVLNILKISHDIITFLKYNMEKWDTNLMKKSYSKLIIWTLIMENSKEIHFLFFFVELWYLSLDRT